MSRFVSWKYISNWRCTSCGTCCKLYSVVLNFPEWLRLVNNFGPHVTIAGISNLLIKRADDGSCVFLCSFAGNYLCSLQKMKPNACKIWPFKILSEPKYGEPEQAVFDYCGKKIYVYADTMCSGLRYGVPRPNFESVVLKEFVRVGLGLERIQHKTTRYKDSTIRRFNL